MRYLDVAETLRARLASGELGSGGALPSEAELGRALGASRVTVRRALELLRADGLVSSRRGAGWFVALDPVRQALGRVTTIEAALEAAGSTPSRRVLEFRFESAAAAVAEALDVPPAAEVLMVRRLSLADDEPFAIVTVWAPAALGEHLSRVDVEQATFYDLLPLRGVELGRAVQTIGAELADDDDAELLAVEPATALLVCHRVTFARDGGPVLASEHRYPACRTTFEIEFPSVRAGAAGEPPGLRLAAAVPPVPPSTTTLGARHA